MFIVDAEFIVAMAEDAMTVDPCRIYPRQAGYTLVPPGDQSHEIDRAQLRRHTPGVNVMFHDVGS